MLFRQQLHAQLAARREEFADFERAWGAEVRAYARRLRGLGGRSAEEVKRRAGERIAEGVARVAGALPSDELERAGGAVVPFGRRWRTHEEARRWALDVLLDRVTCAADGSQILPGREVSLPVAGVQAAWFENLHTRTGDGYRKEWDFRLIAPKDLLDAGEGPATALDIVGLERFRLELGALCRFMGRRRGWRARGERVPVAFFDGTLLLSTTRVRTEGNFPRAYASAIAEAVRTSRETEVPLVGYIDQSYARDLVHLLDVLEGRLRKPQNVFDARILSSPPGEGQAPLLAAWGDRTVFFHCLREGLTEEFKEDGTGAPLVGFLYLQTTGEGTPARLDIPAWVYEAGLLGEVVDAVRAECVVGNGYPYALETADAAAVITAQDREQFLRAMQEFAERERLGFRVARKLISKAHRR